MLHRYVHGNGVDQPLVWYDGGTVNSTNRRHLFANWQGSIAAITNASGTAVAVNAYDAYGIPNDTNIGRFQYTGQILIPEIGIYHYKARAYSPYMGRFLQTDPIGYEDQYNLYAYVGNDPVGRIDPTGMYTCEGKDCGRTKAAIKSFRRAIRNMGRDSNGLRRRAAANKVLNGLGSENDGTGPTIQNGDSNDYNFSTDTITMNFTKIGTANELGSILAHEGQHRLDGQRFGAPKNAREAYNYELRAYRVQSYVSMASGGFRGSRFKPGMSEKDRRIGEHQGASASCLQTTIRGIDGKPVIFEGQICPNNQSLVR